MARVVDQEPHDLYKAEMLDPYPDQMLNPYPGVLLEFLKWLSVHFHLFCIPRKKNITGNFFQLRR